MDQSSCFAIFIMDKYRHFWRDGATLSFWLEDAGRVATAISQRLAHATTGCPGCPSRKKNQTWFFQHVWTTIAIWGFPARHGGTQKYGWFLWTEKSHRSKLVWWLGVPLFVETTISSIVILSSGRTCDNLQRFDVSFLPLDELAKGIKSCFRSHKQDKPFANWSSALNVPRPVPCHERPLGLRTDSNGLLEILARLRPPRWWGTMLKKGYVIISGLISGKWTITTILYPDHIPMWPCLSILTTRLAKKIMKFPETS